VTGAFDARFEGPPGLVHAGMLTFGFEFALGMAAASAGARAFSVSTTVNYRKPLRVGSPVRFEAEMDRVEGRKILTKGSLSVGPDEFAVANGVHIRVDEATWNAARSR
jgi:acyl-coenzyme A thioesterase PaaI-like protein